MSEMDYWRPDLVVYGEDGVHVIDPDGRVIRLRPTREAPPIAPREAH